MSKGERSLLAAVVFRAMLDADDRVVSSGFYPVGQGRDKVRDEAREWIESDDNRAFSFVWCCSFLGVEPRAVRQLQKKGNYEFIRVSRTDRN
jgi:hypothetical protein